MLSRFRSRFFPGSSSCNNQNQDLRPSGRARTSLIPVSYLKEEVAGVFIYRLTFRVTPDTLHRNEDRVLSRDSPRTLVGSSLRLCI